MKWAADSADVDDWLEAVGIPAGGKAVRVETEKKEVIPT
jgi:hypothetical protein